MCGRRVATASAPAWYARCALVSSRLPEKKKPKNPPRRRDTSASRVPIMALFRMENPELGAPAVAPSVPAWCPGGRTHTNATRAWSVSTRSTACTTPPPRAQRRRHRPRREERVAELLLLLLLPLPALVVGRERHGRPRDALAQLSDHADVLLAVAPRQVLIPRGLERRAGHGLVGRQCAGRRSARRGFQNRRDALRRLLVRLHGDVRVAVRVVQHQHAQLRLEPKQSCARREARLRARAPGDLRARARKRADAGRVRRQRRRPRRKQRLAAVDPPRGGGHHQGRVPRVRRARVHAAPAFPGGQLRERVGVPLLRRPVERRPAPGERQRRRAAFKEERGGRLRRGRVLERGGHGERGVAVLIAHVHGAAPALAARARAVALAPAGGRRDAGGARARRLPKPHRRAPVPGDVPGDGGVPEHPRGRLRGPRLPGLATGAEDVPDRPRRPLWRAGRLAEHGLLPCVVPGGDARVQPLAHRRDVSRGDRGVQREHGERCGRGHGGGVFLLALVLRQVRALGAGGLVIRRRRGVRRDVDVQAEVRQASHARGGARRRHGARIPRGRRGDRQRRCFFFMLRDVGHDTVRGGIDGRAHRGRGVVRVHRGRIRCLLGRSTRIVQRAQLGHALRRAALRARFCGHARRVRLVVARHRPTRVSTTARPPLPPRRATSEA